MSTLTAAEAALATAQATYATAQAVANSDAAAAASLRSEVAAGNGSGVSASDLATADHVAEYSALAAQGAYQGIETLSAAVATARADAIVDEIVSTIPKLAAGVVSALDALVTDLASLVSAVDEHDAFTDQSRRQLATSAQGVSSRVNLGPYSTPTVDRIPLASCRGWSQLVKVLVPFAQSLGATSAEVSALKNVAQGAPTLPTN